MITDYTTDFRTYDQMFIDLVKKGPTTFTFCRDNDGIWRRLEAKWLLEWLIDAERYEDCQQLKDIMEGHWDASDCRQCELDQMMIDRGINLAFNENNY